MRAAAAWCVLLLLGALLLLLRAANLGVGMLVAFTAVAASLRNPFR
jgi:hypothetical protein